MTLDALLQLSNKCTPRIDQLVEGKKTKISLNLDVVFYCYFNV